MPILKWNETEFIEYLETLPIVEEDEVSHCFEVSKDDLLLQLTIWQYESIMRFAIFQDGIENAAIAMTLIVRDKARYVKEKKLEFLEFCQCIPAPSHFSYLDFKEDLFALKKYPYSLNMRLFVKPQIEIQFVPNV